MTYEEAIKEYEEIIEKLNNSSLTIEEGKKLFERGKVISKFCCDNLKEVKGKVLEIKKELGTLIEEDFEEVKNGK